MTPRPLAELGEDLREAREAIGRTLQAIAGEIGDLGQDGRRSRQALLAATVVPIAVTLALLLRVDDAWWAAISGYVTVLATGAASLQRGILRLGGTVVGAAIAFVMARWLPYDHVALCLFVGATTFAGAVGMIVSGHGVAWLFAMVTTNLVLLASIDAPPQALEVAFDRVMEVAIGVSSSAIVTYAFAPRGGNMPTTPALGWRHLLDRDWPVFMHGIRAAIAAIIVLNAWVLLELPNPQQMAITVVAVMASPTVAQGGMASRRAIAERALHRLFGCLLGGAIALVCLAFSVTDFLVWLTILAGGMWAFMYVQTSARGIGYVGTQAAVVFIMTMVQGFGPPDSILPGVDRFAGIAGGLTILLLVSLLLWPRESEDPPSNIDA